MNKEIQEEYQELEEHVDPPQEKNPHKRKPAWVREAIQGAERYGAQKNITEKGKELGPAPVMYPYYVTSLIKNLPTMKKWQKGKNGRMLLSKSINRS